TATDPVCKTVCAQTPAVCKRPRRQPLRGVQFAQRRGVVSGSHDLEPDPREPVETQALRARARQGVAARPGGRTWRNHSSRSESGGIGSETWTEPKPRKIGPRNGA